MAKKKQEAPKEENAQQNNALDEIQKNLNNLHVGAFDRYLEVAYPNGIKDVPQPEIDKAFEAFRCGFNSGIIQAGGEILMLVGINLNELVTK